jgi:hypothetical protein
MIQLFALGWHMAKKLPSGLKLMGIAPNILLKHVENTAPWLFQGEIDTTGPKRAYLAKLVFYKKNLKALAHIDLTEYFHLCLAAHWTTAGTFVPTDVDNQIREGLWRHETVGAHLAKMAKLTIDSWQWDYEQVTNRKSYNPSRGQVMSTHEGTWLSVAIGGYNALIRNKQPQLAQDVADVILAEIEKEEKLLLELREKRDHINFLRSTALMAHNFGDLDRVMDQWQMNPEDPFHKRIYKLGHRLNESYSQVLVYAGQVNKAFLALENHRHMSMRQPRCLRKSHKFLIPVGPFMDDWGKVLAESNLLTPEEKVEIIAAFYEGYGRQDHAYGYVRAYHGMIKAFPEGLESLGRVLPHDFYQTLKKSKFATHAEQPREEFELMFKKQLDEFVCPVTELKF